ncbi:9740_t:CDS:2, partial [Dentiscutata erythropus]
MSNRSTTYRYNGYEKGIGPRIFILRRFDLPKRTRWHLGGEAARL